MVRRGDVRCYDLWGSIQGRPVDDPMLPSATRSGWHPRSTPGRCLVAVVHHAARDRLRVQPDRASQRTQPPLSAAAAVIQLRSRFSQAVARPTAWRPKHQRATQVVLVRTDRVTGETRHWDSSVETPIVGCVGQQPVLLEGDGGLVTTRASPSARRVQNPVRHFLPLPCCGLSLMPSDLPLATPVIRTAGC
jgi:hypothetical protein